MRDYLVIGTTLFTRKMELRFRAFVDLKKFKVMIEGVQLGTDANSCGCSLEALIEEVEKVGWKINDDEDFENVTTGEKINMYEAGANETGEDFVWFDNSEVMQFVGLEDEKEKDFYIGDIGKFDNGDKFQLLLEDHLEVSVVWIGDPKCEDQARDLYRISRAVIVGNIYENPELLEL